MMGRRRKFRILTSVEEAAEKKKAEVKVTVAHVVIAGREVPGFCDDGWKVYFKDGMWHYEDCWNYKYSGARLDKVMRAALNSLMN